jgi:hydroxymethylglutaryl-CoA lyase
MNTLPNRVEICDVGPRDGLQALPSFVPTERKVKLVRDLLAAGFRSIEVASFVSPKAIPQMRDAHDVLAALGEHPGVTFSAFVPNRRGVDGALEMGVDYLSIATYTTEEFSRRNVNATVAEANARIREVVGAVRGTAARVRGYVSCAVDCPVTGPVSAERSAALAQELLEIGCDEVYLADTTGHGTAASIARLADTVLERVPAERLGIHFHDTYGQGLSNVRECLQRGIARVDTSVAGLGGCPNAEGAAGNVATEDLLVLLAGMGVDTGIDPEQVARIGADLCRDLGIRNESKAGRAIAASQQTSRRTL